jgi:hypothetical protein
MCSVISAIASARTVTKNKFPGHVLSMLSARVVSLRITSLYIGPYFQWGARKRNWRLFSIMLVLCDNRVVVCTSTVCDMIEPYLVSQSARYSTSSTSRTGSSVPRVYLPTHLPHHLPTYIGYM